ncbi:MAG: DUF1850 domain-containing protein [Pseudomonadota bacterium]
MGDAMESVLRWRLSLCIVAVLATLSGPGEANKGPQHLLEVFRCGENVPLLCIRAAPGDRFSLWFFHSYDRAFFQEDYDLEKTGRIVLSRMVFRSCLNGQGFDGGVYRPLPDGSAELVDVRKEFSELTFRLGSPDLADHALIFQGKRFRLLDYACAGDLLCIRFVVNVPISQDPECLLPEKTAPRCGM